MIIAKMHLVFEYKPALLTKVSYALKIHADPIGAPDNATSIQGNLVLPNGSYHLWYNAP